MIEARYLEIGGSLCYVEITGAGRPVLCVHTAGQSGVQWRHTTRDLAALGYRVVVPDLPGHGRSEPAVDGPVDDLGTYAEWLRALSGVLELDRPYVVGCSIGGKIALDMAVRCGGELSGIVAMAAEAGTGSVKVSGLRRELEDVAAASRTDRTYLGTLAVVGGSLSAGRAELIAQMHRREDPAVSTSDLIGWGKHDVSAQLPSITCPVHLVAGEDDLWVDAAAVRAAAERIPGSRCTVLPGIGHYPMEEIDGFAEMLHGWLGGLAVAEPGSSGRGAA